MELKEAIVTPLVKHKCLRNKPAVQELFSEFGGLAVAVLRRQALEDE